jgi:hypothetical protein
MVSSRRFAPRVVIAIGATLTATTATLGQQQEPPQGQAETAPQEVVVVIAEEEWAALAEEPTRALEEARVAFLEQNKAEAANDLMKATAFVHLEAARSTGHSKGRLTAAARDLTQLAGQVESGRVDRIDQFDGHLAKAEHALAFHYHERAKHHLARNAPKETGHYLKASARAIGHAAEWTGHEAIAATRTVVGDTFRISGKLVQGIGWVPEEVGKVVEDLGAAIDHVGRGIHGERPTK